MKYSFQQLIDFFETLHPSTVFLFNTNPSVGNNPYDDADLYWGTLNVSNNGLEVSHRPVNVKISDISDSIYLSRLLHNEALVDLGDISVPVSSECFSGFLEDLQRPYVLFFKGYLDEQTIKPEDTVLEIF